MPDKPSMLSTDSVVKHPAWRGVPSSGHYEFQDESIHDAPKHRAVVGGGGR